MPVWRGYWHNGQYAAATGLSGVTPNTPRFFICIKEVNALFHRYSFLLSLAVLCAACSHEDSFVVNDFDDRCPDDPHKTSPGKCGCGAPDEDNNDNGTIDCLETDDQCPADPQKDTPGICGCGLPDQDTDNNGIIDCLETDDLCPTDPEKYAPGLCGCNTPDNASNIADSDGDNTIDCLDKCPQNPHKTVPDIYGCDDAPSDLDTDGDGLPDAKDACPENPDITVEISNTYIDCNPGNEPVIEITKAADFETLRETMATLYTSTAEGQSCSGNPTCLDENTILECHNNIWRARHCATCTDNTCQQPDPQWRKPARAYTVRIMNHINLSDAYETTISGNTCTTSKWQSIPHLNNVRFEAVNQAVIRFTLADGTRCALPQALFQQATLSEFQNLNLDFDMTASAQSALVNHLDSSKIQNVVYKGTLTTEAAQDIGAITGYATSSQSDIPSQITDTYCQQATVHAPNGIHVGCIAGRIVDTSLSTGSHTNDVIALTALENAGGLVGTMSAQNSQSKFENAQNHVALMSCTQYCGGALGICDGSASISNVKNTIDKLQAEAGEYIAGFAGGIYLLDDSQSVTVTDIESTAANIQAAEGYYSAGFVAYTSGKVTYRHIRHQITKLLGDFYTGGCFASAHNIQAEDIHNIVTEMTARNTVARPAYTGGFAAETSGGTYTQILSRVAQLINDSSKSGSLESEYEYAVGGFIASAYGETKFEHISSWSNIYANFISSAGFLGRQEANWVTPTPSSATLNHIVSMSRIYAFTDSNNIKGSATEKTENLMAGKLEKYTTHNAYFYKRGHGVALASENGAFLPMTDSNKSDALTQLQNAWNGWKSQTISLGSESISNAPSFE